MMLILSIPYYAGVAIGALIGFILALVTYGYVSILWMLESTEWSYVGYIMILVAAIGLFFAAKAAI